MAKAHRSDGMKSRSKAGPPSEEVAAPPRVEPNPPKRHPLFLMATAVAMALWLLFLLWMASG
jgi:hypothetical protein